MTAVDDARIAPLSAAATGAPKPAPRQRPGLMAGLQRSFVWALEVETACRRVAATGRPLTAETIRQVAGFDETAADASKA